MKYQILQFALRQMQVEFSNRVLWIVLIGVGVVLALAGAFGTGAVMRPLPLMMYWIVVVIVTYAMGSFVSIVCNRLMATWNRWVRIACTGIIIGLLVFGFIIGVNSAIFGAIYDNARGLLTFAGIVICVTSLITLILDLAFTVGAGGSQTATTTETFPPLLERLPLDHRGALVSISVEDHYVNIRTTKGGAMVLMRLGDAIKETAPTPGLQVHRSHWISIAQVTSAQRSANGAILTMTHGDDIPVSRTNIAAVKDAGLLVKT